MDDMDGHRPAVLGSPRPRNSQIRLGAQVPKWTDPEIDSSPYPLIFPLEVRPGPAQARTSCACRDLFPVQGLAEVACQDPGARMHGSKPS